MPDYRTRLTWLTAGLAGSAGLATAMDIARGVPIVLMVAALGVLITEELLERRRRDDQAAA